MPNKRRHELHFCKNKGLKIEVFDENENNENFDEKKKKYF